MEVDGQRAVRDEVARCRRARRRAPHCGREVKPPRRLAGHLHAPAMTSTLPPDFGWSPGSRLAARVPAVGLTALAACTQRSDVDAVDRLEDLAPHSSGEEITIGADGIRNPRCGVSRELDR